MNRLVIDQGTVLDRIDFNLERAFKLVTKGKEELVKVMFNKKNFLYKSLSFFLKQANKIQKSPRANNCVLYLFVANLVFLLILVGKYTLIG